MTEVLFYHLTHAPLERALPELLEKTLARGWRACVEAAGPERVAALDTALWTYRDDAFLPHGASGDDNASRHPIVLTDGPANPNGADVRFFVDGATPEDGTLEGYERAVFLFDGHDDEAVAQARAQWKAASAAGHTVTYWAQEQGGKWERKG